jgi:hypothetical protein
MTRHELHTFDLRISQDLVFKDCEYAFEDLTGSKCHRFLLSFELDKHKLLAQVEGNSKEGGESIEWILS